jgi:hypothetical protein
VAGGYRNTKACATERIAAEPALAKRLRNAGLLLRPIGTPAGFAATLAEQRARWATLARLRHRPAADSRKR